jgi:hypothetical protein
MMINNKLNSELESRDSNLWHYKNLIRGLFDQAGESWMLSDTLFELSVYGRQCPTLLVKISTFVGQNVGQSVGYNISIATEFVRQLLKTRLDLMP